MQKTFLYLALFCGLSAFGQPQTIDSVRRLIKTMKADTNKVVELNALSWYMMHSNPDTSIVLATEALHLSQNAPGLKAQGWGKGIAKSYSNLGVCYEVKGDYPVALDYFLKGLQKSEEIGSKKMQSDNLNNMGLVYYNQANYPKALDCYQRALKIGEALGYKDLMASTMSNMGGVYTQMTDYPHALDYFFRSLKLAEATGNKPAMANAVGNIGSVYELQAKYDLALEFYFRTLKLMEELQYKNGVATTLGDIGVVYNAQGDHTKALEMYQKALTLSQELGDKNQIATWYGKIGSLYVETKKYPEAQAAFDLALKIDKETGSLDEERVVEESFAKLYEETGKEKLALDHYRKSVLLKDSLYSQENKKQLVQKEMNYAFDKKETASKAEAERLAGLTAADKKKQQIVIYSVAGVLLVVVIFSFVLYRRFKITQKQKRIIELQKEEVSRQKMLVEEHQKEIIDSITYAKRLQQAIMPSDTEINKYFADYFLYYQPKDIVAGDFYWMDHLDGITYFAAADSTGHGVPGALVSVVCSNALNRSVNEFDLRDTGKILDKTRELVLETFAKSGEEIKDGMDISLCRIVSSTRQMQWSGANNSLWYIKKGETSLSEIKADKQPIGKTDNPQPYTTHHLDLQQGDIFYLMTDGYPDQFGGQKGKKFKYKQLQELLVNCSSRNLSEQRTILADTFTTWKGNLEQIDDVTIIGVRL